MLRQDFAGIADLAARLPEHRIFHADRGLERPADKGIVGRLAHEGMHDGYAQSRGDQLAHHLGVVALELHLARNSQPVEDIIDALPQQGLAARRNKGDTRQIRRLHHLAPGERMLGGQDADRRQRPQRIDRQRGRRFDRQCRERDIELAFVNDFLQPRPVEHIDGDPHFRISRRKAGDRGRNQAVDQSVDRNDPHLALGVPSQALGNAAEFAHRRQHLLGLFVEADTFLGQPDPAAIAPQQLAADLLLELRDQPAHGRLRDAEQLGCGGHGSARQNIVQCLELPQPDHGFPLIPASI